MAVTFDGKTVVQGSNAEDRRLRTSEVTFPAPGDYTDATTIIDWGGSPPRGWDNTRNVIPDFANNNIFLGVPNVTQDTLPFIEPFIGGYGRVWALSMPRFFEPSIRGLSQRMIERMCKGLSGIGNYELQTAEITYGNNAESYSVPTGIKKGNNNFNLKFQETQGGMFRKISKYWVTGISDLGSGYGTYHGKTFDGSNLRFSPINHSGIILYALTDNSGGAYGLDSIEFACIWFGAFPNQVPNSHFEYTQGEHSPMELDIPFFGIFHENNAVNSLAAVILEKSNFYADNYSNFDLGVSVWHGVDERLSSTDDTAPNVAGLEPQQGAATQYSAAGFYENGMAAGFNPAPASGGE